MLCGALATVAAYGVYKAGKWTTVAVGDLSKGLVGIGVMAENNKQLADNSLMVATELQLLRSVISGNNPAAASSDMQDPSEGAASVPKPTPTPFPSRPPDAYRTIPDATIEDTTVDDTDDARMVAYEKLEEMRQAGIEADPEELLEDLAGNV